MPQRSPITLFICRFLVVYFLLVLPWPGWGRIYNAYFRAVAGRVFAGRSGLREVSFETAGAPAHPSYARIDIVNRNLMQVDGSGPVRNLDLDTLALGWRPMALLAALIVTTPVSWPRRGRALLWGLLCMHVILLLFVAFCIWNDSSEVLLVSLSPFWKNAANGFRSLFTSFYSLVIPVVIWVLVTFRREDREGTIGVFLFGPAAGRPKPGKGKQEGGSRERGV